MKLPTSENCYLDRIELEIIYTHLNFRIGKVRKASIQCKKNTTTEIKPQYQYRLGDDVIESSPAEKDLGLLVDEKLDMS